MENRLRYILHIVFWIVVWVGFVYFSDKAASFKTWLFEGIHVALLAFLAYFNLLRLMPSLFHTKAYGRYLLLTVLLALSILPIRLMTEHLYTGAPFNHALLVRSFYIWISYVVFIGLTTLVKVIADWARLMHEKTILEKRAIKAELDALRNQIHPHFLLNTLNAIYSLALQKSDHTAEAVLQLSDMMRYMLYESATSQVPLVKEVDFIKNYIALQQLRFCHKGNVQFHIDGDISQYAIAPFILFPLVENAFKHGLSKSLKDAQIRIRLHIRSDVLSFNVANSFEPHHHPYANGGVGLANLRSRLNRIYPNRHQLIVQSNDGIFYVHLQVHLKPLYHDTLSHSR